MMRLSRLVPTFLSMAIIAVVLAPVVYLALEVLTSPGVLWAVFASAEAWTLLGRSVVLAMMVAATSVMLGTALAWITVRATWPGWLRLTLTVLLSSTLIVPSYVLAFALLASLGPTGSLGWLIPGDRVVRDHPFLSSWIVLVICTYPYVLLSVRSVLYRECGSVEEAALNVGATRWQAFRRITLPRLAPSMCWGGMLAGLYALADFGAVSLLGYHTLTWGIYHRYEIAMSMDEARALCFMLMLLTLTLLALMRLVRPETASAAAHVPQPPAGIRFRWWAVPAALLILLPLMIGLLVPIVAMVSWLPGLSLDEPTLRPLAQAAMTTLGFAAVAALVIPAMGLPIATLHLGRVRRTAGLLTPLTLIGFALPGIVIAIAGAGLALRADEVIEWVLRLPVENRLYQSHLVVMLAYATLFLPEAVGPLRGAAARVHADQLDAAAQLGAGPWRNFARIALPQMLPGFAAGAALVFATSAKELPATLLLAPPNVHTLATRLWSNMEEAFFAQAAAAALVLLIVTSIGLAIVLLLERVGRTGGNS